MAAFDLDLDFSAASFSAILDGLRSDSPGPTLSKLHNMLLYGDGDNFQDTVLIDFVIALSSLLAESQDVSVFVACGACVASLVDMHWRGAAVVGAAGVLKTVADRLRCPASMEVYDQCLRILFTLSVDGAEAVGAQCDLDCFLVNFYDFSIQNQRKAIETLHRATEAQGCEALSALLVPLGELLTHHDAGVSMHAVQAFANIGMCVRPGGVDPLVMEQIAVALHVLTAGTSVVGLLRVAEHLVDDDRLAERFLLSEVDLWLAVNQAECRGVFMTLLAGALDLALKLVPPPSGAAGGAFMSRGLSGARRFASAIEPFVRRLLIDRVGCESRCLKLMAAILGVMSPARPRRMVYAAVSYALVPALVDDVFLVLQNLKDKVIVTRKPSILVILKRANPERFAELFRDAASAKCEIREVRRISKVDDLLRVAQQYPWELYESKAIPMVMKFLASYKEPVDGRVRGALTDIVRCCHELLAVLSLPDEADAFNSADAKSFMDETKEVILKHDDTSETVEAGVSIDFMAVEGWWNTLHRGVTSEDALARLREDPVLSLLVDMQELQAKTNSWLALLHRACNTDKYCRAAFRIGDRVFSVFDNVFQAIASTVSSVEEMKSTVPVIEIIPCDSDERPPYEARPFNIPEMKPILDLLKVIRGLDRSIGMVATAFSRHVLPHLASPALTIGRFSQSVSAIMHYPFVFPLDLRILFVQLTMLETNAALMTMHQRFVDIADDAKFRSLEIKCVVRRDHIWEDGLVMLEKLGPGGLRLMVKFDGEDGIGMGPTHEFFTLFASEMCKRSMGLWTRNADDGEFVKIPRTGLFPRVDANPAIFRVMGLMFAKAFSMSCVVPIPLSPAFWEVLRNPDGCRRSIHQDIDEQMVQSLKYTEGLHELPFVYPGTDIELVPGGSELVVDQGNAERYVRHVKEMMLCKHLVPEFRRGFTRVIPWEATALFSSKELSKIFHGSSDKLSVCDLDKFVVLENGYVSSSPTVRYLFQVLSELRTTEVGRFLEFATGSRHLPIGGLAALSPCLTVAKKAEGAADADRVLPSVMTCTNYLKLPEYTTKERLREKLFMAINEGRGAFFLT